MNVQLGLTTIATVWMSLQCLMVGEAMGTEKPEILKESAAVTSLETFGEAASQGKSDEPYQPRDNGGPDNSQGSGTR
jgi:hypothetical protein